MKNMTYNLTTSNQKKSMFHQVTGDIMYGNIIRVMILRALINKPQNKNQLANSLKVDYKTIQYHMRILEENSLVSYQGGNGFPKTYFVSRFLEDNVDSFNDIIKEIELKNKKVKKNE